MTTQLTTLYKEDPQDVVFAEGTHLLLTTASTASSTISDNATSRQQREHAFDILLSTTLSRLGSRTWEFATPLLLLEWSPGSLAAPALLGLACNLFRTIVSPWLGRLADDWDRMRTVWIGTSMQAVGCFTSVMALILYNFSMTKSYSTSLIRLLSLALVITAGVIEKLGAQLASVAVKKEWLPIVFNDETKKSSFMMHEQKKITTIFSFVNISHPITLSFINTTMTNIDLLASMFGPVLAGFILQKLSSKGVSLQRGFTLIALFNVVSFAPETYLLRKVFLSCSELRHKDIDPSSKQEEKNAGNDASNSIKKGHLNPWKVWINHPSGLQLLTLSLASLYLTALSPSGIVLTSYLVTIGLSPTSIGVFRGIGAVSGVIGIFSFSLLRQYDYDDNKASQQSTLVKSIERLRGLSLAFLLLEVVSVLVTAAAYRLCDTSAMITSVQFSDNSSEGEPISWQIYLFLGAIVVSRAGLYSFDVGVLEIEQYLVDERFRNAIGSVEGALCSVCEMGMYVLSIALPNPSQFGWQIGVSAAAVSSGGLCFGMFLGLYHMHLHHHQEDADCVCDGNDHSHGHHHHHHTHTIQQERDLKQNGYHIHLHRHDRSWR
jgi:hypothetical protein